MPGETVRVDGTPMLYAAKLVPDISLPTNMAVHPNWHRDARQSNWHASGTVAARQFSTIGGGLVGIVPVTRS